MDVREGSLKVVGWIRLDQDSDCFHAVIAIETLHGGGQGEICDDDVLFNSGKLIQEELYCHLVEF